MTNRWRGRRARCFPFGRGVKGAGGSSDRLQGFQLMSTICVPQRSGSVSPCCSPFRYRVERMAGCATLPSSGPTGIEIRHAAVAKTGQFPFTLVEVETPAAIPAAPAVPVSTLTTCRRGRPTCSVPATSSTSPSTKRASRCSGPRSRLPRPAGATVQSTPVSTRRAAAGDAGRRLRLYQGAVHRAHAGRRPYRGRAAVDDPERPSRHVAGPAGPGFDRAVDHQQRDPCRRSGSARVGWCSRPTGNRSSMRSRLPAAIAAKRRTRSRASSATARASRFASATCSTCRRRMSRSRRATGSH